MIPADHSYRIKHLCNVPQITALSTGVKCCDLHYAGCQKHNAISVWRYYFELDCSYQITAEFEKKNEYFEICQYLRT